MTIYLPVRYIVITINQSDKQLPKNTQKNKQATPLKMEQCRASFVCRRTVGESWQYVHHRPSAALMENHHECFREMLLCEHAEQEHDKDGDDGEDTPYAEQRLDVCAVTWLGELDCLEYLKTLVEFDYPKSRECTEIAAMNDYVDVLKYLQ